MRAGTIFPSRPFHLGKMILPPIFPSHLRTSSHLLISISHNASYQSRSSTPFNSRFSTPSTGILPASQISSTSHLASCPSRASHLPHSVSSLYRDDISWTGISSISFAELPSKHGDRNIGVHRPCQPSRPAKGRSIRGLLQYVS